MHLLSCDERMPAEAPTDTRSRLDEFIVLNLDVLYAEACEKMIS